LTTAQGGTPKDSRKRKGLKDSTPFSVKEPQKRVAREDTAQEGKKNDVGAPPTRALTEGIRFQFEAEAQGCG